MRVIIAGSRTITNLATVEAAIKASGWRGSIAEVVSGGARGVDTLAEAWAAERGIAITRFPADWRTHGRAAGPMRNREMAEYADALIAVWDGESRGTANMIEEARKRGLPIHRYHATP